MKRIKKQFNVFTAEIYQPDEIYAFKEDVIAKRYPGAVLVGEFATSTMNDNIPMRWYRQANPDRSKGHKDYFALFIDQQERLVITGLDESDFESKNERYRQGIHCLSCNTITYSKYRHDYHGCKCGKVTVDGGSAYTKIGFKEKDCYNIIKIDLLTQKVVKE